MERVTATFDDETPAQARGRLARLQLLGLLDELEAKHGAAPKAVRKAVARDAKRVFR